LTRLSAKNLTVGYGNTAIVSQLHLNIPDGKITTIIGPNGCGKSTLLKTLSRILKPKSGTVYLDGKEIEKQPTKTVAKKLAILPQAAYAPEGLTVRELVSYGRYPHQKGTGRLKPSDWEKIDWAIHVTGLTALQDREIDSLSGGQRQKVWIAMALAQETDLILLDEPTTYLDMSHQLEVLELLQYLNQTENRTIVMVLHDLNHAARFSHYMVAMKNGIIVKDGTPEEVLTPEVLREVFQIDAVIGKDPRTKRPICLTYHALQPSPFFQQSSAV